ncbi:GNAT family N-acetyltransferase [Micromonospora sp. NBC_01813]|uniref:GNAT family N-acetyltransferase n=1 Tax=Micromonospora sp. NBC_01813 TaxID=2975988 RepID=UPI002DD9BE1E|nr:GNAT family N-acetyltransferase [Micromonospora sp. NBC_01813]WSA07567.1 GNAT family N-acetyltransferase [Micromonospora sp. NBC_01813]
MEIRIRTVVGPAEIAALAGLDTSFSTTSVYRVAVREDGFGLSETPVPPLSRRYDLTEGVTAGSRPWDLYALAVADTRPVGFMATTYERWNGRQVVNELHVAPAHRRRGLARDLLGLVAVTARENGAREIWLETQNVNIAAVRAYRRLGFALTGIDTTRYLPPYDDEVALFMSAPVPPGPTVVPPFADPTGAQSLADPSGDGG